MDEVHLLMQFVAVEVQASITISCHWLIARENLVRCDVAVNVIMVHPIGSFESEGCALFLIPKNSGTTAGFPCPAEAATGEDCVAIATV
jgi:hypothetical protein